MHLIKFKLSANVTTLMFVFKVVFVFCPVSQKFIEIILIIKPVTLCKETQYVQGVPKKSSVKDKGWVIFQKRF